MFAAQLSTRVILRAVPVLLFVITAFFPVVSHAVKVLVKQKTHVYSKPSTRSGRKIMVASRGSYFEVVGKSRTGVFLKVRKGRREGWILTKRTQPVRAVRERPRRRNYQQEYDDYYDRERNRGQQTRYAHRDNKVMELEGLLGYGDDVGFGAGGAFYYTLKPSFVPAAHRLDLGGELMYFPSGDVKSLEFSALAVSGVARYYIPMGPEFLLGPELGLTFVKASFEESALVDSDSETKVFLGGSAQYSLGDAWRVVGSLRMLLGGDVGGFLVSGGAAYRF